jgi:putative hemolysin
VIPFARKSSAPRRQLKRGNVKKRNFKTALVGLSLIVVMAIAMALTVAPIQAAAPESAKVASDDPAVPSAAAAYCVAKGGVVEVRTPYWNTNDDNPDNWLRLAGSRNFCEFTATDGSRIHVLLATLYTQQPSLAALAYYFRPKLQPGCHGNPASCYCTQLGGSDSFGGITINGGGWVLRGAIDEVLEACIFPDMSSIDSWGLTYHSAGIVRGKALGSVLRFKKPRV